jgi:hypothetical protein
MKKLLLCFASVCLMMSQASKATPAAMPASDFGQAFVQCARGPLGSNSVSFDAFVSTKLGRAGTALLISAFRPFYQNSIINQVTYSIGKNHRILIEHPTFTLTIDPDGKGLYRRKGEIDTPPDLPPDDANQSVMPKAVDPSGVMADYFLFQPIELSCVTPFTPVPIPPTGFSTGN